MRRSARTTTSAVQSITSPALSVLLLALTLSAPAGAGGLSKIVYTSFQGGAPAIWIVRADGSSPARLLPAGADGDGAALSSEGTRVVYESPRYGYGQLFMINTDGTGDHRVLSSSFYGQSGTWSPDGSKIAFTHSSNNGQAGGTGTTWVVNANGTGLRQLSPGGVDDWAADWSPDGTKIAFTSIVGGHGEIFVMNADGTNRQQLTSGAPYQWGPRWSPDGAKLAYTSFPPSGSSARTNIHVMNAGATGDAAVTDTTLDCSGPAWSPDGDRISFASNRSGCFQIYTMANDGSDVQRVTWVTSTPGDFAGDWGIVTLPAGVDEAPGGAGLELRAQSPARARSSIHFATPRETETSLEVFDSTGRLVRRLLRQRLGAGAHTSVWDGRDDSGRACPAGVYHCRLVSGEASRTAKLVLAR
jgi:TolB protein